MPKTIIYKFETERLLVDNWHSITRSRCTGFDLVAIVRSILTPAVTRFLPPQWQGRYTHDRAQNWINERDSDGASLLVVETASQDPIGLVILLQEGDSKVRLGYMLSESAWGRGLASELIGGFASWCRANSILTVVGGVDRENVASRRVLEKNGFRLLPETTNAAEQLFELRL